MNLAQFILSRRSSGSGGIAKPYIDSSKMLNFSRFFARVNGYIPNDLSLLPYLDTSNAIDVSSMFDRNNDEYNTEFIEVPQLDLRNAVYCNDMFYNAYVATIPSLDLRKATDCSSMFFNAYWLESCGFLDTRSCENFRTLFFQCHKLKTMDGLRTENGTNFSQMFQMCASLISIGDELDFGKATNVTSAFDACRSLQEVRFKAIRVFDDNLSFIRCQALSVESLLSILNALSDNTGLDTTYIVHLGSGNLAKLTEEQKEIAYNKNIDLD